MKILLILKEATEALARGGIEEASVEADILVMSAAGVDRITAYRDNPSVSRDKVSRIKSMIRRRTAGEPLQYILGEVQFLDLRIRVGKGVLIPRPETEFLAGEAIGVIRESQSLPGRADHIHVLDLCSGSGCIALSVAAAFPEASVTGTDISETAVSCATENALLNGISNAIFLTGSLFEPLHKDSLFDLILSNPPYIRSSDIPGLQREIREWEPEEALDGGTDGLDYYRRIFPGAATRIRQGGLILVEVGFGQAEDVMRIAGAAGFAAESIIPDLAGIERVLKFSRKNHPGDHGGE